MLVLAEAASVLTATEAAAFIAFFVLIGWAILWFPGWLNEEFE